MKQRTSYLFSLLLALLLFPAMAASTPLILGAPEWPPYIGKNLKNQGYTAQLVTEAFQESGITVTIKFMPWARAMEMAKDNRIHGLLPIYYSEERAKIFLFSDSYPGGPLVFMKRVGETIPFTKLADLKPYRIGVVRGYANTPEFDGASDLQKIPAKDDITNIRKLLANRVDLIVMDRFVAAHLLATHMPDKAAMIDAVSPPLGVKDLHISFGKGVKDAKKIQEAFNNGLRQLKAKGRIEAILDEHGF